MPAGALNTPVSSLGDPARENPRVARWMEDCRSWLGLVFGTPKLDVPQENMRSMAADRAHLGIPAFRFPGE